MEWRRPVDRMIQCDYCELPIPLADRSDNLPTDAAPVYCCYGCRLAAEVTGSRGEQGHAVWMLTRLGISVFFTMAVMVAALYLYGEEIYRQDPSAPQHSAALTELVRYTSLLLATPVMFMLAVPLIVNAWEQVRAGRWSTDGLVVLGVGAAYATSVYSTVIEPGPTYFETACMVLVLMTLGRYLEATGRIRASRSIRSLETLVPDEVRRLRAGRVETVTRADLAVDDRLWVQAGEAVAADGTIVSGQAHLDEHLITGESAPVPRDIGQTVRAGTINLDGRLEVRISAVGADSTLGRLIRTLEQAKRSRGQFERIADRVVAVFTPTVIVLSLVAAYLGWTRAGVDQAIMSGLAVLLIACPCALGIATPMAVWIALGRAASAGIAFRTVESMEQLATVRAVAFDKTGTLTTGQATVLELVVDPPDDATRATILTRAAALGQGASHVLSSAVCRYADRFTIEPKTAEDVRVVAGRGVSGSIDRQHVYLGSEALMAEAHQVVPEALRRAVDHAADTGRPIACIGWGGTVRGVFVFRETLRTEAREALRRLVEDGCAVEVLTGDRPERARTLSEQIGVPVCAGLLPEQKIAELGAMRHKHGPVAMVGDGINDAPALASADVGIAMGCGADVTRESADVCLLGDDLLALPRLIRLSRKTVRTIRTNLFWAFAYNIVGVSLAVAGKLSPMFAAGAMVVSSLFVVLSSLRLTTYRMETTPVPPPQSTEADLPRDRQPHNAVNPTNAPAEAFAGEPAPDKPQNPDQAGKATAADTPDPQSASRPHGQETKQ